MAEPLEEQEQAFAQFVAEHLPGFHLNSVERVLHSRVGEYSEADVINNWNFISHVVDDAEDAVHFEDNQGAVEQLRARLYRGGLLDALLREMTQRPLRMQVLNRAMVILTMACLSQTYFKLVCEHPTMIRQINELCTTYVPERAGAYALTCLTNLAIHPGAHRYLLAEGCMQVASEMMNLLTSEKNEHLDCGLSAAFFMCRVAARRDPDLIPNNPILLDKLAWILDQVLKAGPNGVVLSYSWNPANIMLDIYTLTSSTRDLSLLTRFIPLIARALENRPGNVRMTRLAILTLLFFVTDEACLKADVLFKQRKIHLIKSLLLRVSFQTGDLETAKNAAFILRKLHGDRDEEEATGHSVASASSGIRLLGNEKLVEILFARLQRDQVQNCFKDDGTVKVDKLRIVLCRQLPLSLQGKSAGTIRSFAVPNEESLEAVYHQILAACREVSPQVSQMDTPGDSTVEAVKGAMEHMMSQMTRMQQEMEAKVNAMESEMDRLRQQVTQLQLSRG